MSFDRQTTLRAPVTLTGIGVHSGAPATICLKPSSANSGIVFLRQGLENAPAQLIHAKHTKVSATELCTVIGDRASASVATIEHLMSACAGLGLDNVLVEIDGPEMPIMDGSAAEFVAAIETTGLVGLAAPRRYLRILQPVRVEHGRAFAELLPAKSGFRLDVEIDFDTTVIGRQRKVFDLEASAYAQEIARARTFGFMRDVEQLWKAGFALGASLDNTVAVGDDKVINPEGLRYGDEFVRHKVLDAIGDLALAGYPIVGEFRSYCGGHRMNVRILEALFADRANYAIVEAEPVYAAPRAVQMAAAAPAAFAPDVH
ncbi:MULTISPECIES: UDP-3-O-acyl-N-acetylglucosamine deacetylase [unclassified Bosea (in: a-proteobacteria)]|jgi:UDP-3-O-[3-hydroxymyristoyl] N-acetylglucosamine deacetylase|uniref:UDP-3-O-acyl-N-acetylglucosamine deacetylase n=1 Tax=unclassified Bosea (in: a-proteobacteria) TaxID=2653178 RepID=UPI00083E08E9|nr:MULTISPECIES: UDP-3-O-acyl-N-acetylglucosamine deacetylase [unclassified Bosea (in: a-proteobacteria)]AOG08070.1 UDP-3-O-[3-hydroxymyristoyl] N-acetylglucosamine deacetylase [Bosea sp. RAC05]MBA4270291.1 UDP-3-O-acyl-N-acetylglucosamine deacetylase [Methylobacterium sp.]